MKNEVVVVNAELNDLPAWMALVRAVRLEFPGLETEQGLSAYQEVVTKNMARRTALCVKDGGKVVGVLLYSLNRNTLSFLAVDPAYRQQGIALALTRRMLDAFEPGSEIWVTTFRENDLRGNAPRALYQKLGFIEGELIEEFNYPCQKFVLRKA
ncbi:MAG: GNAT family N-acetyltransferase [Anaerolineaceae bacterium]|nr:GNAT family N-acetyltransferase [Anaerolineaceae bacterium]